MRGYVVGVVLLFCGSANAQATLSLSTDTLLFPTEQEIEAANRSSSPIILDSIGIAFVRSTEWHFDIELGDSTFGTYWLSAAYENRAAVGAVVGQDESAVIRVVHFDPCVVCKSSLLEVGYDTLLVYSGGVEQPSKVVLDLSTWVSVEPVDRRAPTFGLSVFPNPAAEWLVVEMDGYDQQVVRLLLYDGLGREVRRWRVNTVSEGEYRIDVSGLSIGAYYLRAAGRGSKHGSSVVVIKR